MNLVEMLKSEIRKWAPDIGERAKLVAPRLLLLLLLLLLSFLFIFIFIVIVVIFIVIDVVVIVIVVIVMVHLVPMIVSKPLNFYCFAVVVNSFL